MEWGTKPLAELLNCCKQELPISLANNLTI